MFPNQNGCRNCNININMNMGYPQMGGMGMGMSQPMMMMALMSSMMTMMMQGLLGSVMNNGFAPFGSGFNPMFGGGGFGGGSLGSPGLGGFLGGGGGGGGGTAAESRYCFSRRRMRASFVRALAAFCASWLLRRTLNMPWVMSIRPQDTSLRFPMTYPLSTAHSSCLPPRQQLGRRRRACRAEIQSLFWDRELSAH